MDINSKFMAMYTIVIKKFTKECPNLNLMVAPKKRVKGSPHKLRGFIVWGL